MNAVVSGPPLPETCGQGHHGTLILPTAEGGSICLLCLSNLLSNPNSLTVHVSYALSQLSQATSQPQFLYFLLTFHSHFLISPLIAVLSNFDDEPIAKQTIDLIQRLCDASNDKDVHKEFVSRVSDRLSSGSLGWSHRQLHMLHSFGILLNDPGFNLYACIKNKDALISNLVTGLQLSRDEIQGEVMFILIRLCLYHYEYAADNGIDNVLLSYCPKLLNVSLDLLLKSQSDDVRINCVAFLTVLTQSGFFENACSIHFGSMNPFEANNSWQLADKVMDGPPLEVLFAEAVKGPLLSSDSQLQIATMDLIYTYLSLTDVSGKECQTFVAENIADYIFEILRLSGNKDPIVNSSIQVLDLLSNAEQAFRQRLAVGFSTLVLTLHYVAEIPYHPILFQLLKLILNCISNCPGIVSSSSGEEITSIFVGIFMKHIGMLPESFCLSCSILVAIMKCSSSCGNSCLASLFIDASRSAVSICLGNIHINTEQVLHLLYLLKEVYAFNESDSNVRLMACATDILKLQVLPWFISVVNEMEDATIALGVIETFHAILIRDSNADTKGFAESLVSSSWFSVLFGCLGLFPSETLKCRVYLIFSLLVDVLLGSDSGQQIRDASLCLPSDPKDLLFLLGQRSSHNLELLSCQMAVLLVLYLSSLYDDRIADDKLVLASLEQFILLNGCDCFCGASGMVTLEMLVFLYSLYRGFAKMSYQMLYSPEAERILFQLMAENEWDSLSTKIHLVALRWLFQQEKVCKLLSYHMLKFCRCSNPIGNSIVPYEKASRNFDMHVLAGLITSDDNFGAMILVCLLRDLVENECEEYDIISVIKACSELIEIAPLASDRLCIHGIDGVLQNIFNISPHAFPGLFMAASQLVFIILQFVHTESITDNNTWLGITAKLMDFLFLVVASDGWTKEVLTVIGIFSLILLHSTRGGLAEASKSIVLNAALVSVVNTSILEACSKGPALLDHDDGTETGEVLIVMLSLIFFSIKSVRAILPGIMNSESLFDEGSDMRALSYLSIRCHDLCKLMHFGSAPIKLIASFCLVENFAGMSNRKLLDLKCREGYLLSITSVLEGLIFFNDIRLALNCSQCLSSLMKLNQMEVESMFLDESWCRLIVEELVMSLSTPSLALNSIRIHQKPALIIAVALLKLRKLPSWVAKVFDNSSIQCVIQNMSPRNVSIELMILFRELLDSGHLNVAHISHLSRVFQACRQHVYVDDIEDICSNAGDGIETKDFNVRHVCAFLFSLVSSNSHHDYLGRSQSMNTEEFLHELDSFTKCLMVENNEA